MKIDKHMSIDILSKLMVEHGLVIRAIPHERTLMCETRRKDSFPNGEIRYSKSFKRDMLYITESNGSLGGKFLVEKETGRGAMVDFNLFGGKRVYDSLEEALIAVLSRHEIE